MHSSLTSAFHLISILLLHHNSEVTARYLEVYCSSLQPTRRAIPKEVQAKIFSKPKPAGLQRICNETSQLFSPSCHTVQSRPYVPEVAIVSQGEQLSISGTFA